jgi:RND family efflux transporter MFP subunit
VAKATKEANEAAVERAKQTLGYTEVRAGIDGIVGRNLISLGNLVRADDTLLARVVTPDPIYVYFNVDQATVLRYQQVIRERKLSIEERRDFFPAFVGFEDQRNQRAEGCPLGFPNKGRIDFADVVVDPATGSLQVRAILYEKDLGREVTPGISARVMLPARAPYQAIQVPDKAIGTDQFQKFVYVVVDKDGKPTIEYRKVTPGRLQPDGMRVIEEGLKAGERCVVNGLQRVRPGIVVDATLVDAFTEQPVKK